MVSSATKCPVLDLRRNYLKLSFHGVLCGYRGLLFHHLASVLFLGLLLIKNTSFKDLAVKQIKFIRYFQRK